MERSERGRVWLLAALAAVALLAIHAASHLPFLADDALISMRYAERLLDGQGLTWSDGERVEGYSNLLWVLLTAALGGLGLDLVLAVRVLGFLAAGAAVLAPLAAGRGGKGGVAGALALAAASPLAIWTVGGLEQPLVAALLGWGLVLGYRLVDPEEAPAVAAALPAGVLLALACWTRPDGPVFVVGAALGVVAARGLSIATLRLAAALAALPLLAWLAQLGFRILYYGDWLPNSAHAKVAFTAHRLAEGSLYVGSGLLWLAPLTLAALVLGVAARGDGRSGRRIRFLAPVALLWLGYVAVVGGDSFPGRRHLVAAAMVLALVVVEGVDGRLARSRHAAGRMTVAIAVGLVALLALSLLDPASRRARLERWEWDGEVVGRLLGTAFADERPLLAADAAGTLPYFSELPAIDMLGINDRHLARNPPDDFGHGFLGHELGDGGYVLDREPDLVVFCGPEGGARPCFRSGHEMLGDPRFRSGYRLVAFEGQTPHRVLSLVWVRLEGGAIGVERGPGRVDVPGFLLAASPRTPARLGADGRLAVTVGAGAPAGIQALGLAAGGWRLRLAGEGGPLRFEARLAGSGTVVGGGDAEGTLSLPHDASIDLVVGSVGGEARLHGIELRAGTGPFDVLRP